MSPLASQLGRTITFGYIAMLAVLVVSAITSFASASRVLKDSGWVSHTHLVLAALADVYASATEAESSQRGYVLTGQAFFIDRYVSANGRSQAALRETLTLTQDNNSQQERLSGLRQVLIRKQSEMQRVIEVRRNQGLGAAARLITGNDGAWLMNRMRSGLDEAASAEISLLAQRQRQARLSISRTFTAYLIGVLTGVVSLTGLYVLLLGITRLQAQARLVEESHRTLLEVEIQEKERAEAELQRSNRELQDFAFVASHDLQEPLRKIQAFGDRIKTKSGDRLDADCLDYLERMQGAALRMQGLINDILDLSRVATKSQPFVVVDLNVAFAEAIDDLSRRIEETSAEIEIGALPTIRGDQSQIRQLAINLVGNALKFHRPDVRSVIHVEGTQAANGRGSQTRLTVSDNGIGFDQRHAEKIFTVFQRLHGRAEYDGSGVGLAICRKIVERHGGTITAISEPGEGATFEVLLPCM